MLLNGTHVPQMGKLKYSEDVNSFDIVNTGHCARFRQAIDGSALRCIIIVNVITFNTRIFESILLKMPGVSVNRHTGMVKLFL